MYSKSIAIHEVMLCAVRRKQQSEIWFDSILVILLSEREQRKEVKSR